MTRHTLAAALILPTLVACESVESESVLTSGVYADLHAVSNGDATRATATLRTGGATSNTFLQLTGDDNLSVSVDGGEAEKMNEQNLGDIYSYTADFDAVNAGAEYVFAFNRLVDEGAPSSVAVLPEPFSVTEPAEDAVISRGAEAITVSWDGGTDDAMLVKVSADCIYDHEVVVEGDPGTIVIEAGTLESPDGSADQACDATVTVSRRRTGSLDAGYGEGGLIYGAQDRGVKIRIDP
ncbi:MAG: hypothetical protein H6741_13895 [Alphaproteobacteria bacterium]|nr:hypothetical protein [Alphaproteobacteria bacterium]MCB9793806.1 hypothetical protein [Alphaproteobacteria bacterium]